MFHLRKCLLPVLHAASHSTTAAPFHSLQLHTLLLLCTSASQTPFSIYDYLVTACGLTRPQALKASMKLSHAKSASKPDAVLALLSDIAAFIAADPMLLHSRVGNVAPRLTALRDRLGLSVPEIARYLLFGSSKLGVGLEYIVERSVLLTHSVEKRLVPRHYVVKILKAKGLMKKYTAFFSVVSCSEKVFRKKYVDCMKDAVPGLPDAYAAICAGETPPEV